MLKVAARRMTWRRNAMGYLFIGPWLIGFAVFIAGPMLASLGLAFTNYNLLKPPVFAGLDNIERLISDPLVGKALWNTAFFTVFSVPGKLAIALLMAITLNQQLKGISFFRVAYYLPTVVPAVSSVLMWMWIYNPTIGPVNLLLGMFGIPGPAWFWAEHWAKPAIILMGFWSVGTQMVVFLAGLQTVPEEMHEAASIDGAGKLRRFWHITLPLLTPHIFFNAVVGIIASWQVFTPALIATEGGPRDATLFVVLYLYRHAFENLRMGYSSAIAWLLFLVVLMFTIIQFQVARRWVYYEAEAVL